MITRMPLRLSLAVFLLLLLTVIGGVSAQTAPINYGQSVQGTIDANTPQGFFTFNGQAGDLVTAYAIGTSPGMRPTIILLGPTGQLAFSDSDPFTPLSNDARVTYRLPQASAYNLLIGSAPGSTGAFLLNLSKSDPAVSTGLSPDQPTEVNIPLGAPSQVYSFSARPDGPTPLVLTTQSPDFAFTALIRNNEGQTVAVVGGGVLQASFVIGPGEGLYEVVISSASPEMQGTVVVGLGALPESAGTGTDPSVPVPAATEDAAAPGGPPANVCSATPAQGAVNVRSGPGTIYEPPLFSLQPGTYLTITGVNSGWYNGTANNGQSAWVFSGVVTLNGPCQGLPIAAAPAPPQQQPPPPAVTEESAPAATEESSAPPTQLSPTEPSAQTAPPDTDQYILEVDRDSNSQFAEVISYPTGDVEDFIFVKITGLSNQPPNNFREFSFTLVCTGSGTENVRWGTGRRLGTLGCGSTITKSFTNDSDQTSFLIGFVGGSSQSYVNYTIVINKIG